MRHRSALRRGPRLDAGYTMAEFLICMLASSIVIMSIYSSVHNWAAVHPRAQIDSRVESEGQLLAGILKDGSGWGLTTGVRGLSQGWGYMPRDEAPGTSNRVDFTTHKDAATPSVTMVASFWWDPTTGSVLYIDENHLEPVEVFRTIPVSPTRSILTQNCRFDRPDPSRVSVELTLADNTGRSTWGMSGPARLVILEKKREHR